MTISVSHDHVGLTIIPEDLDATLEWYSSNLGFTVDQQFESHGTTYTFIISGDAKIELIAGASNRQVPTNDIFSSMDPARLHHICLAVADLDAAIAELAEHGVKLVGGPMDISAIGQRIAFVTDNLGNIIELTDPGSATDVDRSGGSVNRPDFT